MTIYVGGPLDGRSMDIKGQGGPTVVDVGHPTMWYVKTLPTDLHVGTMLFGTALSQKVYEWHERGWEPPTVAAIRAAGATEDCTSCGMPDIDCDRTLAGCCRRCWHVHTSDAASWGLTRRFSEVRRDP